MKKILFLLTTSLIMPCFSMEIEESEVTQKQPATTLANLDPELQIEIIKNLVPEEITEQSLKAFIKEIDALSQTSTYFNDLLKKLSGTLAGLLANKLPLELTTVPQEGNKNKEKLRVTRKVLTTIKDAEQNAIEGTALASLMEELSKTIKYRTQLIKEFTGIFSAKSPRTIQKLLELITRNGSFSGSSLNYLIEKSIARDTTNDEKLQLLLRHGSFIDRAALLIDAINHENYKAIDLLADADTINKKDAAGRTPIFTIIPIDENIPLLKYLINKGADITVKDSNGESFLSSVILDNLSNDIGIDKYVGLINFLVKDKNFDINTQDNNRKTPLMHAVLGNDFLLLSNLLYLGANPSLVDNQGKTALYYAIENEMAGTEFVEKLLNTKNAKADVNKLARDKTTPLMKASMKDYNDIVKLLLEAEADVNYANGNGITPLMLATFQGHYEVVKSLLDAGADVNLASKTHRTALMFAALKNYTRIAYLLLMQGTNINLNQQDTSGKTAMMFAASNGNVDLVEKLLERGANALITDNTGKKMIDYLNEWEQKTLQK